MNRTDSSLSTASAGERIKFEAGGYNYPVVFEDEDDADMMDVQSDGGQKPPTDEDEEMFGMDD